MISATPPVSDNPVRGADDLATIIYTSGTTGTPKGVMHRFAAFSYFAKTSSEMLGLTGEERLLSYLPLAHIIERCACEGFGMFPRIPRLLHGGNRYFPCGLAAGATLPSFLLCRGCF